MGATWRPAAHIGVGDVWVIAGQSNAAGYGKTPCFDPPELGVHMFHACGEWRLATHPLADSTGTKYPLNQEGGNGSQSPFLAFGRRLRGALGYPIGLIPAALGGSPIVRWVRGANGDLFENMLAYIRDAGGSCRGMVWYQGESDTGPNERRLYARRFRNGAFEGPKVLAWHRGSFHSQQLHVHPCVHANGTKVLYTADPQAYGQIFIVDVPEWGALPDRATVTKNKEV